jgi:CHAD domain-containing protein
LQSKRFQSFIQDLTALERSFSPSPDEGQDDKLAAFSTALVSLGDEHKRMTKRAKKAIASGSPQDLHRMRIAVKKTRYGLELLATHRPAAAKDQLRNLRRLQDLLGEINDLYVAADRVTELSERNLDKWDRESLRNAGMLRSDLVRRATRRQGKVPEKQAVTRGKVWRRTIKVLTRELYSS